MRLRSFTAEPAAIASYGPLLTQDGRRITLGKLRPVAGGAADLFIARVEGVATREAAEALSGARLFVARERLAAPSDADEFLLADLIGCRVEDAAGRAIGTVTAVPNYGGGDLLDIAPTEGGPSGLLPFTKAFVPVVDLEDRRIVVDAPEDLFEPAKPQEGRGSPA